MIIGTCGYDVASILKRPYPRVSWSPRAVARRVKLNRERDARRRMMRQLRNGQGVRTGALCPWGGG